jgi:hypothetical protein
MGLSFNVTTSECHIPVGNQVILFIPLQALELVVNSAGEKLENKIHGVRTHSSEY